MGPVRWAYRNQRAVAEFRWGGHPVVLYLDQRVRTTGYVRLEPSPDWEGRMPPVTMRGPDMTPPRAESVQIELTGATNDPRIVARWRQLDAAVLSDSFEPGPAPDLATVDG